ncbi:transmembrane protein 223-domain-containing protein [Chytridium lagenaria]|nr:transmembrane protein 223-domain-containing protein [Chytridium lagenaria]
MIMTKGGLLFNHPNASLSKIAAFTSGSFLLFWMNLADMARVHLKEEDEARSKAEGKTVYKNADALRRYSIMTGCVGAGLLFAYGPYMYTKSLLKSVTLMKGGRDVLLETHAFIGKKSFVRPVQVMQSGARMSTGTSWNMVLRDVEAKRNYTLPKDGTSPNPELFDRLFYRGKFQG